MREAIDTLQSGPRQLFLDLERFTDISLISLMRGLSAEGVQLSNALAVRMVLQCELAPHERQLLLNRYGMQIVGEDEGGRLEFRDFPAGLKPLKNMDLMRCADQIKQQLMEGNLVEQV